MTVHSKLSPSSASRWSRCPGSPLGEASSESFFSAEGTAAHSIAAECLNSDWNASRWIGLEWLESEFRGEVDQEFADAIQVYLDLVRATPGVKKYEVWLDLSEVLNTPDQGGTGDTIALNHDARNIKVIDLKFGKGVQVFAEENEQLMLYGLGALLAFDYLCEWETVTVAISQPRIGHYDERTYSRAKMLEFGERMQSAAMQALLANSLSHDARIPYMHPGETQCRWCPISGNCPAQTNAILDFFPLLTTQKEKQMDIVPSTTLAIPSMSDPALAFALDRVEEIEAWCKAVRAEALARAQSGAHLPGWKIVEGRQGNRAWAKPDAVAGILGMLLPDDKIYKPREVISPTDAEKLMKKAHPAEWDSIQQLITRAPGKPDLAREFDARQAMPALASEFPMLGAK